MAEKKSHIYKPQNDAAAKTSVYELLPRCICNTFIVHTLTRQEIFLMFTILGNIKKGHLKLQLCWAQAGAWWRKHRHYGILRNLKDAIKNKWNVEVSEKTFDSPLTQQSEWICEQDSIFHSTQKVISEEEMTKHCLSTRRALQFIIFFTEVLWWKLLQSTHLPTVCVFFFAFLTTEQLLCVLLLTVKPWKSDTIEGDYAL